MIFYYYSINVYKNQVKTLGIQNIDVSEKMDIIIYRLTTANKLKGMIFMYRELLWEMFAELFKFGETTKYKDGYNTIISAVPTEQIEEIDDIFISAVDAECFEAFKEGFRTAMKLVAGKN